MNLRNHLDALERAGFLCVDFDKLTSACEDYDYLANFELEPGIYIIANEDGDARIIEFKSFDLLQINIDIANFVAYKKISEIKSVK